MGTSYNGGMILGAKMGDVCTPEYIDQEISNREGAEEAGMEVYAEHYDADDKYCVVGYEIPNILVSDMDADWMIEIKYKAIQFKTIFGVEPTLFGMQNIT